MKKHVYESTKSIVIENRNQWHYACQKCGRGEKHWKHYKPAFAMMFNWLFNEKRIFANSHKKKIIMR